MDEQTLNKLRNSTTLAEMLSVLFDTYQLENTKVTPIVKGTIISGLTMAVKMTNPKKR
jgi:hypothetical protein